MKLRRSAAPALALLLLIGSALPAGGQGSGPLTAAALLHSPSTHPEHPAEHLTDGSASTGWRLAEGAASGWAELRLGEPCRIQGMAFSGDLDPGSELRLEYAADGGWWPFFAGLVREIPRADWFADLGFDGVTTDRVRLVLEGAEPGQSQIRDWQVIGSPALSRPRRIEPAGRRSVQEPSCMYPASNLEDGNPRTEWRTRPPRLPQFVLDLLLGPRDSAAGKPADDRPEAGDVEWSFAPGFRLERVLVFNPGELRGTLRFERQGGDGRWQEAAWVADLPAGWTALPVSGEEGEETRQVRLTALGAGYELGGLGEIEFWGRSPSPARSCLPLHPLPAGEEGGPETIRFQRPDRPPAALQLLFRGDSEEEPELRLNGLPVVPSAGERLLGGIIRILPLAAGDLCDGENGLTIQQLGGDGTLCAARLVWTEPGVLHPAGCPDGRVEHGPEAGGELELPLPAALRLERVEIQHADGLAGSLQVFTPGGWVDLIPEPSGRWASIFPGEQAGFPAPAVERLKLGGPAGSGPLWVRALGSPLKDGPPEVRLLWPADGDWVSRGQFGSRMLVGFVDDPRAEVTVRSGPAGRHGHFFWAPLTRCVEQYAAVMELTVRARDGRGRSAERSFRLWGGEAGPFSVDQPAESPPTREALFRVSGRALIPGSVVTVDGRPVEVTQSRFSTEVPLRVGLNVIQAVCADGSGREIGRAVCRVTRSPAVLTLRVESPEDGAYTRETTVVLSGRVQGTGPCTVRVNGAAAAVAGGRFISQPIPLAEGGNPLEVEATDGSGGTVRRTVTVVRDTRPPDLVELQPRPGAVLRASAVTVSVRLEEESPAWVFANGVLCARSGALHGAVLAMPDGSRTISLEARDMAGNSRRAEVRVQVDTAAPAGLTVAVEPGGWTRDPRPVVRFEASDETTGIERYELSLDDGPFERAVSPCRLPALADGEHAIVVRALDRAGWESRAAAVARIDTTPPPAVDGLKLVPGNGKVWLAWAAPAPDVARYRVERQPAWEEGALLVEGGLLEDPQLANGEVYAYRLQAIDRAENEAAFGGWERQEAGREVEPYRPETGATAEYEGITLTVGAGGLPQEAQAVLITELRSAELEEACLLPRVGPIFELAALGADGEPAPGTDELPREYLGEIAYDPAALPEGAGEEDLAVFRFDPTWGRWFRLGSSAVDAERNVVLFSSGRFSEYTVQATAAKELDPDELRDAGRSPLRSYSEHGSLLVSTQGGSVSAQVTELVLPGPGGFDLRLERRYSLAAHRMDALLPGEGLGPAIPHRAGGLLPAAGQGLAVEPALRAQRQPGDAALPS